MPKDSISRKMGFGDPKSWHFLKVQEKDGTVSIAISKRNEINTSSLKQINRLEITFSTIYHRIIYLKPFWIDKQITQKSRKSLKMNEKV